MITIAACLVSIFCAVGLLQLVCGFIYGVYRRLKILRATRDAIRQFEDQGYFERSMDE